LHIKNKKYNRRQKMTGFIIRDDEQKTLFYALIQYLKEQTHFEVCHHPVSIKFERNVNKIRKIVSEIAEHVGYEKKLTAIEWLEIGITKFTTIQEIQEILQTYPRHSKRDELMYITLEYIYKKLQEKGENK
jgi:hypothetical protein